MNILMSGLSLLGFWLAWKFIWQPTLLDTTRDQLFDLRDKAREWFLKNGYGLDNPTYRALRRLLNSHLRMTETVTFSRFLLFLHFESALKDIDEQLETRIEQEFSTPDRKIERYVQKVRNRAYSIMVGQMIFRNYFLVFGFIIFALCFAIRAVFRALIGYAMPIHFFKTCASAVIGAIFAILTLAVASPISNTRMEKYSLSQPGYTRNC